MIRDFHPLVFFYVLGTLMTVLGLAARARRRRARGSSSTTRSRPPTIVLVALLLISGTQFTLFGMWFDQESNKELR